MRKSRRRGQLHRYLPYIYAHYTERTLSCGGVESSIGAPFRGISLNVRKVFNVLLNLFQHLTSLAYAIPVCKILNQVQDDKKQVIACNDGNNFSLLTFNFQLKIVTPSQPSPSREGVKLGLIALSVKGGCKNA